MTTLLLTFGLMLSLIIAMAVGVLVGRNPIKGSCGGLQNLGMKGDCEICGGNLSKCDESTPAEANPDRAPTVQEYRPRL